MHVLSRLWNYVLESYVAYVLTKEDIHELAYQQAHKGGLRRSTFIILGSIFRFAYIVVFVYFTYINFVNLRYNQAFLSLSSHSGECSDVPKIYTFPDLYADIDGHWESELNYSSHRAPYHFDLFEISQTMAEYETFMGEMRDSVVAMGEEAHTHNLAINLLHWCFWEHDMSDHGKIRRVRFTGRPEFIVNLDQIQGTIADVYHDSCSEGLASSYDVSNTHMKIDFEIAEYEHSYCADILVSDSINLFI